MLYFWVAKLVLWLVFWILRYVPIVGAKLSGAYEDRVFRPIVEEVSVTDVRATLVDDPPSLVVEYDLENESWVDLGLAGMNVRVGLRESGGTVHNAVWTPAFQERPRNIAADPLPSEGTTAVNFEYLAGAAIDDGTTIHLDGNLVFEYSFTLRDRRFRFGERTFPLPDRTITVEKE
ncbi:hypothetical protein [Halogranum rubrum]|uniref:Uncharacterized protein n=1 Tax=Halogranum salarium B-1 TaxID=1210908 RepID=J3F0J1_9EURY|nr:hypothetical protein [Halogranum salarium]EJN61617.1 hypothetical protein HSB1_06580 [Halogranum salarium B-1]